MGSYQRPAVHKPDALTAELRAYLQPSVSRCMLPTLRSVHWRSEVYSRALYLFGGIASPQLSQLGVGEGRPAPNILANLAGSRQNVADSTAGGGPNLGAPSLSVALRGLLWRNTAPLYLFGGFVSLPPTLPQAGVGEGGPAPTILGNLG